MLEKLDRAREAVEDLELEPVELSEPREQRVRAGGTLEGVGDCTEGCEMLEVRPGGKVQASRGRAGLYVSGSAMPTR